MQKTKLTKGFTLIELLVVIAIVGILGSIVYAPFQTARRKARDAQKIIEMKNLQASLFLFADSNNGYFPATLTILQASMSDKLPSNISTTTTANLNKYNYTSYKDGNTPANIIGFHLYTHLETKSPALSGAAGCYSFSTGSTANACITAPAVFAETSSTVEPVDGTAAFFINRSSDSDIICATDTTKCIFDLKS